MRRERNIGTMTASKATRRTVMGGIAAAASTPIGPCFSIPSATMRPAAQGIFSSGVDQLASVLAFVNEAAGVGKTIEWGPIDLSFDAVATTGGVRGLRIPSGSRWVMHPDTRFRVLPNGSESYVLLHIRDADDIVIEGCGARLLGDRNEHIGSTGEQCYGLLVKGGRNVLVRDLVAEDFWGDGFYVGRTIDRPHSRNIVLERIAGINNRRQGLSLISARHFRCVDGRFIGTNGTQPAAGIDIEPDYFDESLEDVTFVRPVTSDNAGAGLLVYLTALRGSPNRVDVLIEDAQDRGSLVGFEASFTNTNDPTTDRCEGTVRFLRPISRNARLNGFIATNYSHVGPRLIVDDPRIENWNRRGSRDPRYSSAISISSQAGDSGSLPMGNIAVARPRYVLQTGTADGAFTVSENRPGVEKAVDIEHKYPVGAVSVPYWLGGAAAVVLRDNANASSLDVAADGVIGANGLRSRYVAMNTNGPITLTVNNAQPIGVEIEFVVGGSKPLQIEFDAAAVLLIEACGANRRIQANSRGARLKIRKTGPTDWEVRQRVGAWKVW